MIGVVRGRVELEVGWNVLYCRTGRLELWTENNNYYQLVVDINVIAFFVRDKTSFLTTLAVIVGSTSCHKPGFSKPIEGPKPEFNKELNEKVSLYQGDITKLAIDVIVNAANSKLAGGGGVDGAIHKAAGRELQAECATLNGCKTGCAKITKGYKLPAKYIIHTVGPKGENSEELQSAYQNSLDLAVEKKLRTIAFPCISTGVYGYPQEEASIVALKAIRGFLEHDHNLIERIIFCVFLDSDKEFYEKYLPLFFPLE
ncbi:PREDICTED: macro domain-containing protein mll7730-like [Diuraphis noxia]|uniref:macro domain-containing protein mll7730-like n=1 Tax=Diuraphis noxia TaxID=143948 RepID=UPI0007635753|nr:PREDICTED: macro domain-containing protein mll7730-like [Diuraphis noxia]